MSENYERLIQLVEDVFAVKNDPEQLDVDENVIARLNKIHPATLSEFDNGEGPVAWVLLIPTTLMLMEKFLNKTISEKQLYEATLLHNEYNAVYLCSAIVLEEYRRKGLAGKLAREAIAEIQKDFEIVALYVWAFTPEGEIAAESIAKSAKLPLYKRK